MCGKLSSRWLVQTFAQRALSPTVCARLFCRRQTNAQCLWCELLCARPLSAGKESGALQPRGSGSKWRWLLQIDVPRVSRLPVRRAIGAATDVFQAGPALFRNRVRPGAVLFRTLCRAQAAVTSHRRGAPWTGQWQWPAGVIARHVYLRGCDEIPRARTRRPELTPTYPHAHPRALSQWSLLQA